MPQWSMTGSAVMYVLDGGPSAVPPDGSGGVILAGAEVVYVGATPDVPDEGIRLWIGDMAPPSNLGLSDVFHGQINVRDAVVRVTDDSGSVLWSGPVGHSEQAVSVWVDDVDEPAAIWFQLPGVREGVASVDV